MCSIKWNILVRWVLLTGVKTGNKAFSYTLCFTWQTSEHDLNYMIYKCFSWEKICQICLQWSFHCSHANVMMLWSIKQHILFPSINCSFSFWHTHTPTHTSIDTFISPGFLSFINSLWINRAHSGTNVNFPPLYLLVLVFYLKLFALPQVFSDAPHSSVLQPLITGEKRLCLPSEKRTGKEGMD